MILALLAGAAALAATWTAALPLPQVVDEEGLLLVPAGVALRLEVGRGEALPVISELPTVRNPETSELQVVPGPELPVDTRGVQWGLLVPLADEARLLRLVGEGRPRVRATTRRDQLAAWLQVARRVERAPAMPEGPAEGAASPSRRARRLDGLTLPWGDEAVAASVRLRARALSDRGLRALGTAHDLAPLVPLHKTTHALAPVAETLMGPDERWELPVQGPATVVLSLRPRIEGPYARADLHLSLDGRPLDRAPLAGSGASFRREELFLTPGPHRLALEVPGVAVQARVELARLRAPLLGPDLPSCGAALADPLAQAELAWLCAERDAALAGYRAFVDQPGPRGELARARVLALTRDPAELLALAALPEDLSEDGLCLATDALLERAAELPPDRVAAAVLRAEQVDPARVARWLDGLGGQRSRGTALLRASRPLVDDAREVASHEVIHRSAATRFTLLEPLAAAPGSPPGRRELAPRGPGVPRVAVGAGEVLEVDLPDWGPRSPVLRLLVVEPASWTLDGESWSAEGGELGVGLSPGPHHLEVTRGTVYLLDPEVAPQGRLAWERTPVALPMTWPLPDPGARVDLRLTLDPPIPVEVELDDGALLRVEPGPDGTVPLTAGTWAQAVTVGPVAPGDQAHAVMEMRVRLAAPDGEPPPPVTDVEAALVELAELSRAIDQGVAEARLARAALLGRMALLSWARRDLRVLLEGPDPLLASQARRLAAHLVPAIPSAPIPGPTSPEAALARHGDPRRVPAGPPEARALALEQAARELGDDPALWRAAGQAWADTPHLAWAWQAGVRAGAGGAALHETLLGRTAWTPLAWPSGGSGLVQARLPAPEAVDPLTTPTWRRARDAMLAVPWPAEETDGVLRGDVGELARAASGEVLLDLYCRDEQGPGLPCEVALRVDEARSTLVVPDGQVHTVRLGADPRRGEVEVGGPGPDHAVALRLRVDGARLPPPDRVTAHRTAPGRPLAYDVGGPLLLRVQALRGAATLRLDGVAAGAVRAGQAPAVVAVVEPGPHRLTVEGDADVRAWAGTRLPGLPDPAEALAEVGLPPELLVVPEEPLPVDVDAIFGHVAGPPLADLRAPGRGGSGELGLSAHSELLSYPTERWQAGQLLGRWLQSGPRHWAEAGGWLRGPGEAAGLEAEAGRIWPRAFAGLQLDAAWADSITGPTGSVGATLRGRTEPSLGSTLDLRLEGRLRAAWLGPEPVARVDGRAWTRWSEDHPVHLVALASVVGSPLRDLRWEAGLRATTNTGPSLDRMGPFAKLDLLLPTGTVVGLDGRAELRFADEHRDETAPGAMLDLDLEHGAWDAQARWWRPWAHAGWRIGQGGLVASAGLRVLLGPRRGLLDLPPGSVAFRSLRDLP